MRIGAALLCLSIAGCVPAAVTRIGPSLAPRPRGCEVELIEEGPPTRPYRDVGMVTLENCQDHRTPPCRAWLEEAVCEIGGTVAYLPEHQRPRADVPAPMTIAVMVAIYAADAWLRPDAAASDCDGADTDDSTPVDKCVE